MTIKRYAALIFSFVVALFLDTAVLPKWNLFDLVPFVMLALMLASQQVFSLQTAILIGAFGGLFEDLLCENMIGLTPALCLYCLLLALAVEVLRALAARIIGMRFSFLDAVLYGALPRALLTGLWALLFMAVFKPLLKRQVDTV